MKLENILIYVSLGIIVYFIGSYINTKIVVFMAKMYDKNTLITDIIWFLVGIFFITCCICGIIYFNNINECPIENIIKKFIKALKNVLIELLIEENIMG